MRVGLFVPCYIDRFYPRVGVATLRLLQSFALSVDYPPSQTCCGQPMANLGCCDDARPLAEKFLRIFKGYDYVVCPSGSCVSMVRHRYHDFLQGRNGYEHLRTHTFELCEFLVDVLKVEKIDAAFPYKVGLHQSCHGLRELRLAQSSERVGPAFSKVRRLLGTVRGIDIFEPERRDECCGFGGSFAVTEEAVSCLMGQDRLAGFEQAGAEVITSVDMSCLMHLEGLIRRQRKPLRVLHIAEIFAGAGVGQPVISNQASVTET